MPTIAAFPDDVRALVRVEVNWADTPTVDYAKVVRYNPATGECVPLRPYVCYDGDYLALSCGHGIWHDTEMPLDTEFYYITEALSGAPCLPAEPSFVSTFSTPVGAGWGLADTGQPWTFVPAVGGTSSVAAGVGNSFVDGADETNYFFAPFNSADIHMSGQFRTPALTTGVGSVQVFELILRAPASTSTDYISLQILPRIDSLFDIRFARRIAGVGAIIGPTIVAGAYAPNVFINAVVESSGGRLRATAWSDSVPMPPGWMIDTPNTADSIGTGFIGARMGVSAGNTNVPITQNADNIIVTALCEPCVPVSVDTSASPTIVASNGAFRLRDPVRPCNDQVVPLCFAQPTNMNAEGYCIPANGIFFASMDTEVYQPNTLTLNPTNAKYPIAITRTRRGVSSVLTLVTRTFDDRDALIRLAEPGSPLFWQGPAAYGIKDQYMNVGDLAFDRGLSDHKFQVRIATMPYVEVARPAGPSQGVCGSQVRDLCDFTWGELVDAGYTWDDLIRGRAGGALPDYRTWDDVESEFADWNAVDNGTRTWTDLEVGD